jgi:hypothetical protein
MGHHQFSGWFLGKSMENQWKIRKINGKSHEFLETNGQLTLF